MSLRSALLLGALVIAPTALDAQSAMAPAGAHPPLKRRPQPTTTAITENDLMSRLYLFADDSMMGREAGTPGAMKGTAYIAAEVRRLGLVPAGDALNRAIRAQVEAAIAEGDLVLFVVDVIDGVTAADVEIAHDLRRAGRPDPQHMTHSRDRDSSTPAVLASCCGRRPSARRRSVFFAFDQPRQGWVGCALFN